MGFLKAKYCVPVFMLVLLTSGVPLNANNDGDILPIADAVVKHLPMEIKYSFVKIIQLKKQNLTNHI